MPSAACRSSPRWFTAYHGEGDHAEPTDEERQELIDSCAAAKQDDTVHTLEEALTFTLQNPMPDYEQVSATFADTHTGVDLAAPEGTAVLAPADGMVTECSYNGDDGYYLVLLHGLPRRAHKGVLLVLAVPLILYPTLFGQDGILADTAWMFLYDYLLAAYLRRWPDNRLSQFLNRPAAALALGLGLPLANTAVRAVLEWQGATDSKAFQYIAYYRTALGALPGLLAALALFHFFKNWDLGSNRFVNALAGTTLGVYILHQVPVLRDFLWNGIFHAQAHHGSAGYTLLVIVMTFAGCAAIDALRTKFIMQPLQRSRAFTALCAKGDALAAEIAKPND